jgi:hypothetical protein
MGEIPEGQQSRRISDDDRIVGETHDRIDGRPRTYAELTERHPTWRDVTDAYGTYADLLAEEPSP